MVLLCIWCLKKLFLSCKRCTFLKVTFILAAVVRLFVLSFFLIKVWVGNWVIFIFVKNCDGLILVLVIRLGIGVGVCGFSKCRLRSFLIKSASKCVFASLINLWIKWMSVWCGMLWVCWIICGIVFVFIICLWVMFVWSIRVLSVRFSAVGCKRWRLRNLLENFFGVGVVKVCWLCFWEKNKLFVMFFDLLWFCVRLLLLFFKFFFFRRRRSASTFARFICSFVFDFVLFYDCVCDGFYIYFLLIYWYCFFYGCFCWFCFLY